MKAKKVFSPYSQRGIMLIELLIVMTAIGVLLGVAMPNIKSLGAGFLLHSQAIQIAQDIRYTQHLSLSRGRNYMFQLDKREGFYFIKPANNNLAPTVKRIELSPNIYFHFCSFSNYQKKSDRYYIEFNSITGVPSQVGRIEIADKFGNRREIKVEIGTGKVVVR